MQDSTIQFKPCELISWYRFEQLARILANAIRETNFNPDMIIGICRGGYFPARLLSDYFGVMNLASMKIEHYHGGHKDKMAVVRNPLSANVNDKRVLLVDDVSDSGDTFAVAIDHLHECGHYVQLKTAVLHHKTSSKFIPDYYAEKIIEWRWLIYPWAVTEDLASLIHAEMQATDSLDAIQSQLLHHHGIKVSNQQLAMAIEMLRHSGQQERG